MRWKFKYDALKKARIHVEIGKFKNGKPKYGTFYICAECKRKGIPRPYYSRQEVSVDHIIPCVAPEDGFVDWNTYIPNLLCTDDNLQILCKKPCHAEKTARENETRKINKKTIDKRRKKR